MNSLRFFEYWIHRNWQVNFIELIIKTNQTNQLLMFDLTPDKDLYVSKVCVKWFTIHLRCCQYVNTLHFSVYPNVAKMHVHFTYKHLESDWDYPVDRGIWKFPNVFRYIQNWWEAFHESIVSSVRGSGVSDHTTSKLVFTRSWVVKVNIYTQRRLCPFTWLEPCHQSLEYWQTSIGLFVSTSLTHSNPITIG